MRIIKPPVPRSFDAPGVNPPDPTEPTPQPISLECAPNTIAQQQQFRPTNFRMPFSRDIQLPSFPATLQDWQNFEIVRKQIEYDRQYAFYFLGIEMDVFGLCHYRCDVQGPTITLPTGPVVEAVFPPPDVLARDTSGSDHTVQARIEIPAEMVNELLSDGIESVSEISFAVGGGGEVVDDMSSFKFEYEDGTLDDIKGQLCSSESSTDLGKIAQELGLSSSAPSPTFDEQARFRPSKMAMEEVDPEISPEFRGSKFLSNKLSKAYRRQQATDLPDTENCALWLTNLPANITAAAMLRTIRTGAVFALHINPPKEEHSLSAAKLVFMEPSAAAEYLRITKDQGIFFGGLRLWATYNKHGYRKIAADGRSRVLQIKGPSKYMNRGFWEAYLGKCFKYQLGAVRKLKAADEGQEVIEFQFARLDGQSECGYHAITKEPKFRGIFSVRYGADPCDPKSGYC